MATNYRFMTCSPEAVFDVLANGWLYPSWVVGASAIRAVDADWPRPSANIHHSFGVWPALVDDVTSVLLWDPPRRMQLKVRAWPVGEARVEIEVRARREGCVVRIFEDAVAGPAVLVPRLVRDPGLHLRNNETLRRLAYLAEGGAAEPQA